MISIVVPVYNEEESLQELYNYIKSILDKNSRQFEVIFVDDGSTDGSSNILTSLKNNYGNVKVITFMKNKGKAQALMVGFKASTGKIVITMDADLQDDASEIPCFIKEIEENGYDLVSGWKQNRKDSFIKNKTSKMFNFFVRMASGINLHDFNCGFKAYKGDLARQIRIYGELHRFIPVLLQDKNIKIGEIKVKHNKRKFGKTKYGISRFVKGFMDFVTVILISRFSKRPLHFFGYIGTVFAGIGFLILTVLSVYRFIYGNFGGKNPTLLLGMLLLLLGVQFFCTGLLGEFMIYFGIQSQKISEEQV